MILSTENGIQLAKVEQGSSKPYDTDFEIKESEEIIGIYGCADYDIISQLGFIIWTPPKLWFI